MMLDKLGESTISEVRYRVEWEEDWDTEEGDDLPDARERLKELVEMHPGRRFRLIAYVTTETVIDVATMVES